MGIGIGMGMKMKTKIKRKVMEATPPKLRFVGVFEYGIGWGLGQALVPLINDWTKNYQHFLVFLLAFQLLMAPFLYACVFESIRWLISEGDINKAQIELRRACKWNGKIKQDSAQLAQKIAQVQVQQLRKASSVIETKLAPMRLAGEQQHELGALSQSMRRSFALAADPTSAATTEFNGIGNGNGANGDANSAEFNIESPRQHRRLVALSPTLVRQSFSVTSSSVGASGADQSADTTGREQRLHSMVAQLESKGGPAGQPSALVSAERQSLTTQALVQLALKHSNAIQQQEEGSSFLARMFHRKLYKMTILLMLISVMLETAYYSLVQANGFVGGSVNLNYYSGAIIEWCGAFVFILVLWLFNRRLALILPTLMASCACLGIALAYHLIPDSSSPSSAAAAAAAAANGQLMMPATESFAATTTTQNYLDVDQANITGLVDQPGSLIVNETIQLFEPPTDAAAAAADLAANLDKDLLLNLRERINFWLMILGKLSITVAIQIGAVIAMEAYPNNLRQSGSGAIVFVGRIGSILAPFLINDTTPQRTTFKLTLAGLALLGVLISMTVPCFLPDNKDQELCDRLNEIPDDTSPSSSSSSTKKKKDSDS